MKFYFKCPKCNNNEDFIRPSEERSSTGCMLFIFGGVIPAILFANHQNRRIQCARCSHIFQQPPIPSSPLAKFASWQLLLTVVLFTASIFVYVSMTMSDALPSIPVIATIEDIISTKPLVAAYLIALLFVVIVISCLGAIIVSNAKFRKRLSTEYRINPYSVSEISRQKPKDKNNIDEKTNSKPDNSQSGDQEVQQDISDNK